jgi:hypothetical protein
MVSGGLVVHHGKEHQSEPVVEEGEGARRIANRAMASGFVLGGPGTGNAG